VAEPTITSDLNQAFDVHVLFPPEIPFNLILMIDHFTELRDLIFS
jgi:hypothetical protein